MLGISLLIQVFGLVPPLMFQVVMDKVLTNRAFDTLSVVAVAMLLAAVFETLLTGLRNYIFAHTTNRMDVELGAPAVSASWCSCHWRILPRAGSAIRWRACANLRAFATSLPDRR